MFVVLMPLPLRLPPPSPLTLRLPLQEGVKASKFFILNDGLANMSATVASAREGAEPATKALSSGMYFGELSLIDDEPNKSTVVTTADSEFFTLTREAFDRVMSAIQSGQQRNGSFLFGRDGSLPDVVEPPKEYKFADLEQIAVLGSGTFGRVSLVREKTSKLVYALKVMLKTEIVAHKQQQNVINEKNIMMQCNHPFILRLYQTFRDQRKLYMLLEFVQGGELFAVVHTTKTDGIPDAQAKFYAAGIILALGYLHKKDVAYRDLKPENCLIDAQGYPKLIDFGFAKVLLGSAKTYTLCGTPEYLAPELVLGRGHNRAVDYWAFGILVYEMQAGFSPFSDAQGSDQVVICRNIVNGRLSFPRNFNTDCKDLVKRLLVREIQNRLGNQVKGLIRLDNQASAPSHPRALTAHHPYPCFCRRHPARGGGGRTETPVVCYIGPVPVYTKKTNRAVGTCAPCRLRRETQTPHAPPSPHPISLPRQRTWCSTPSSLRRFRRSSPSPTRRTSTRPASKTTPTTGPSTRARGMQPSSRVSRDRRMSSSTCKSPTPSSFPPIPPLLAQFLNIV